MREVLEIDGKTLYPIREVLDAVSYSRDYITRLAREGKITAQTVGRQWFIDLESLKAYAEQAAIEQQIRKQQLSEERKRERLANEAADAQAIVHQEMARFLHVRAAIVTFFVLGSGLLTGLVVYETTLDPTRGPAVFMGNTERQAAAIPLSEEARTSPVAVGSAQPRQELRSIENAAEGILLLPSGTTKLEVAEVFSDEVVVRENTEGLLVVVRVDQFGNQVGTEIPFVSIPVKAGSK